ncbi:MAG: hypothetical protein RLN99_03895 [Kiloniellaceae bacterium]
MVGGTDYEGELAAARLRMRIEQQAASPAECHRLRLAEGREQLTGRVLVLALAAIVYGLVVLFG